MKIFEIDRGEEYWLSENEEVLKEGLNKNYGQDDFDIEEVKLNSFKGRLMCKEAGEGPPEVCMWSYALGVIDSNPKHPICLFTNNY